MKDCTGVVIGKDQAIWREMIVDFFGLGEECVKEIRQVRRVRTETKMKTDAFYSEHQEQPDFSKFPTMFRRYGLLWSRSERWGVDPLRTIKTKELRYVSFYLPTINSTDEWCI